jgi:hypothetical protein
MAATGASESIMSKILYNKTTGNGAVFDDTEILIGVE